jgi:hypothetical protein
MMVDFRHNLTPVEVKAFLKSIANFPDELMVIAVKKIPTACPLCANPEVCLAAAVSAYAGGFTKITHEIRLCLKCDYRALTTLMTCERL